MALRLMIRILTAFLLIVSRGARCGEETFRPNLRQGNLRVGGSLSLTGQWFFDGGDEKGISFSAPLEYFVIDGLSLGIRLSATNQETSAASGRVNTTRGYDFGPAFTWYFWARDRVAVFTGLAVQYDDNVDTPSNWKFTMPLGFEYFFTPAIALGPQVQYILATQIRPTRGMQEFLVSVGLTTYL